MVSEPLQDIDRTTYQPKKPQISVAFLMIINDDYYFLMNLNVFKTPADIAFTTYTPGFN